MHITAILSRSRVAASCRRWRRRASTLHTDGRDPARRLFGNKEIVGGSIGPATTAARGVLRHLVMLVDELTALGIAFVTLAEGIDATPPAGKLQLHILAAIAAFDRARVGERVEQLTEADIAATAGLSTRVAAKALGVSPRWCAGFG